MQVRADQLAGHLKQCATKGLRPIYTLYGDEPLLAQEACDAVRAAARAAGHTERQVHTVAGAHFDWSGLLGASQAMSLFADRQIVEIRIPSGKPGKDGSEALQRYCETLSEDVVTIVQLPKLDRTQQSSAWFLALDGAGVTVRVDAIDRKALPTWIAQRLAAQGQRVMDGEAGQQTLAFFADRVEGNLMAAHQEVQKLGLLYPAGELSFEQIESAVLNVARYDVFKLGEAVLAGQVARALRMLDGLQAEGEAAVLVHWTLANDILALKRVRDAMNDGKPLPMALREARVWGAKERLFERAAPVLTDIALAELVEAAQVCDGLAKGLRHPGWPLDAWAGLRRLSLMICERVAVSARKPGGPGRRLALSS
ncbi:DNA polymerase III subunit delta [Piscinibacter gummiphilus]|uniref:DNA polymerase III subunit delta n=1 Tax=Piscinibacter gummiphilus TaxID=946333 RepID=A0A1W6LG41_9BURK|nr:DNA polymerase III subunit delta [Piscinibacter gummiphilus]ARN23209.1 DNA polymerase III subunit delta [Piscinibacter gummiphilus]ATU67908.1 DNA polymerase III subunit delta [Piscinibacter gummiphilus]GLS97193.1 DNA polymerase III subunit delta [Piscinibacter gummiphilus]